VNDLALFGTVRTKAEQEAWLQGLIDRALEVGAFSEAEAKEFRETIVNDDVHAIPMTIGRDSDAGTLPLTPERAVPKEWNGQFTIHKWAVTNHGTLKFTHIVCLEGPKKETDYPFYFDGKEIAAPFAILLFDQATDKYLYIHCENCAVEITQWLAQAQAQWQRNRGPTTPEFEKATHAPPRRLQ
jgi:hypothetical protein